MTLTIKGVFMHIEKDDIAAAIKARLITSEQADKLWLFWEAKQDDSAHFKFIHVLYYLGGLIAISAVTLFITQAWDKLQGWPSLLLAVLFFLGGLGLTHYFLRIKLRIPAGIMATFSLAIVPLIVYNVEYLFGWITSNAYHHFIIPEATDRVAIYTEFITLIVGLCMFYVYRLPFLLFLISFILWYMSMDFWFSAFYTYSVAAQITYTIYFGLLIIALALCVDFYNDNDKEDYAFWFYIFGVIIFWSAYSSQQFNSEWGQSIYCVVNVAMIFIGALLNRRIFAILGVLGILAYLGHLAWQVFADSISFPIVLVLLGITIIFIAAFFNRIENRLKQFLQPYIPTIIAKKKH